MITENELNISNDSYTKKDFYQIYPEILDLATKLSKRWDPQSSNESDPGVVLLKLLAFIADKNNYNIDKNILECFMPSCTQEESMRKLCDMMGYSMNYYQSAVVNVLFKVNNSSIWDGHETADITFPRFETTLTNDKQDVNYVLIENVILNKTTPYVSKQAMEGTLCDVTVADSNVIKLYNLDNNNRVYLPETSIAENGVWIWNYSETLDITQQEYWTKSKNLNLEKPLEKVWKFGYDSARRLPYVEFPDDISKLIGDGLVIKYLRTSGVNGNISASYLTTLSNTKEFYLSNTEDTEDPIQIEDADTGVRNIYIINNSASTGGSNLESINEAYNGFKKTIGTFDTLVTCRDYANAIYNLITSKNTPLVSNVQVSDIRNDLSKSAKILTFDNTGSKFIDKSLQEDDKDLINHFDLYLYPFNSTNNQYNASMYRYSFQPFKNISDIKNSLKEYKTLSHNILTPNDEDLYCVKNYFGLNARITTTYKVNAVEQSDILNNIYSALYKNFNCREVDFGESIPFDTILETIQNADARIKNVSLDEPEISTSLMFGDGDEISFKESLQKESNKLSEFVPLFTKNILAGRVPIFDYDTRVVYLYNQKNSTIYGDTDATKIKSISTEVTIDKDYLASNSYKLHENESVQFIGPELREIYTYPCYVNYWLKLNDPTKFIDIDQEYQLQQGDILYINYTDTDNTVIDRKYEVIGSNQSKIWESRNLSTETVVEEPTFIIFKPNFKFYDSSKWKDGTYTQGGVPHTVAKRSGFYTWGDDHISEMFSLTGTEELQRREFNSTELTSTYKCFWLIQNGTIPFDSTTDDYILQEDEYFFYTDIQESFLVSLEAGTRLTWNGSNILQPIDYTKNKITIENIAEEGISAFSAINWQIDAFTTSKTLKVESLEILNLTKNDSFQISDTLTNDINNTLQYIDGDATILYGFDTTTPTEVLHKLPGDREWQVRSRLNLNVGPETTQLLKSEQDKYLQEITINYLDDNTNPTIVTDSSFNTNYNLQMIGNTDIDVQTETLYGTAVNDFIIYTFTQDDPELNNEAINFTSPWTNINIPKNTSFTVNLPPDKKKIIMINCDSDKIRLVAKDNSQTPAAVNINHYNVSDTASPLALWEKLNVVEIPSTAITLTITNSDIANDHLIELGDIKVINGFNIQAFTNSTDSDLNDEVEVAIKAQIASITQTLQSNAVVADLFWYNAPLDNNLLIDVETFADPQIWYDHNNICNRFVLSELDLSTFKNITIAKSSRL